MKEKSISKADEEMRPEYRREDLGKGVRGKYFARVTKRSDLALLNDKVAKASPTGEAVSMLITSNTMTSTRLTVLTFFFLAANCVLANEQNTIATSESRDASTAYLGTANFVVGRIGRDCLSLLGRNESPQVFVGAWQQRNGKYLYAVQRYMEARLREAEAFGGVERRNSVVSSLNSVVRSGAEATIKSWLDRPDKEGACRRAIGIVESGAYDVSAAAPMYGELEALVAWAQK